MFLLDDVLLAPGKAAFVLFQELARKAQEEWLNDDTVKQELQQLYEMLESGRISDKDFEAQECRLLERLEQIARIKFQDKWGSQPQAAEAPVVEQHVSVSALDALPPMSPQIAVLPPLPPAIEPPPVAAAPVPPPPPVMPVQPIASPVTAAARPLAIPWLNPQVAPVVPPPAPPQAPVFAPAPIAAPPPVAPADAPTGGPLTMGQVIDCAVRSLAVLKMRVSTITSVMPEDENWRVNVELVERRGIPDTNDVLGLYELRLDRFGNVLRYERTLMRRRCDFAR